MNTNRISTDIKHAKEALEKKLNSLQTGMDGIPNLLTPSFDSIKNVLSTVTTKVDNVRGGVDLNHTTLTDLQQRLTKVEGSVGKVEQDVGGLGVPSNLKIVVATNEGVVLDIKGKGKGKLYACGINSAGEMRNASLDILIDGVSKKVSDYSNASVYGGCISIPCLLGLSNASLVNTVFGAVFASNYRGFRFTSGNIPNDFDKTVYVTQSPIPFSSLKANATLLSDLTYALIAYTLDE